jgi:hypothetical protein
MEKYNIRDGYGQLDKFCRIEYIPRDLKKITDFSTWKFVVDEETRPDWLDEERVKSSLNERVKRMFIDDERRNLSKGCWILLSNAHVKTVKNACIKYMLGKSKVDSMHDSSRVLAMFDSSNVDSMHDSSSVFAMYDFSRVEYMCDSSRVEYMRDSSSVGKMFDSSRVEYMSGSSKVGYMYDSSRVFAMYDSSRVFAMYDSSRVERMYESSKIENDERTEK